MLIQEWQRVRTDWLTVRPAPETPDALAEPAAPGVARESS
jgi:hypothetical protein